MRNGTADGKKTVKPIEIVLIVLIGCFVTAINNGVRVNYGLISSVIAGETGIGAVNVSFSVAIAQLLYGVAQPFSGALALRKTNSHVLIGGCALLVAGFLLIPLCTKPWMLNIALGLFLGCGTGAMAFGIVMSAVTPMLGEKRAVGISGIINGAGGIGGAVLSPFAQSLSDAGGLRAVMIGLTALTAVVMIASVWLYSKEKAFRPAGNADSDQKTPVLSIVKEALRSKGFLHLALAFFTCGYFMAIIETQLYSQILSYGFSGDQAALAFTVYGIMGMVGPMIAGFLCLKMKCKWVVGTCYALRPLTVIAFLLMPKTLPAIFFFVVFLGLIGNSTVPPTTNLLSKLYGSGRLGLLSGTAFVFHQAGSFISTWLGGILVASTGNYVILWLIGAALATAAAILCYTVDET
jgi:predicted MFS family arabinose efflux permease